MARELITRMWCDRCLGYGETHEEATKVGITITIEQPGSKPLTRVLDLCDTHYKEYVDPLADLMVEEGAKPGFVPTGPPKVRMRGTSSNKEDGPFRCLVPGCASGPLVNRGSFNAHVRQQHGLRVPEYREQFGEPVPEEEQPALLEPVSPKADGAAEAICPECGKRYAHELGNNRPTQALGVHRAREHGVRSTRVTGDG